MKRNKQAYSFCKWYYIEFCKTTKCKFWLHFLELVIYACFFLFDFIVPFEFFITHMETWPLPVKGCKFWPMLSTHGLIEQWGFLYLPHLLRLGPTVNNGHLKGPVTLTPVAERVAVELSLPIYDLGLSWPGIEPQSPACEANALPLRHRGSNIYMKCPSKLNVWTTSIDCMN